MTGLRLVIGGAMLLGGIHSAIAQEGPTARPIVRTDTASSSIVGRNAKLALPIPLESLPALTRAAITKVITQATITAVAPADDFTTSPELYHWLLDHPDRVSAAWNRLKVGAVDIRAQKDGRFIWQDESGSELVWQTVAVNKEGRIWYAEGKARPGALLPLVPVTAVAVLRHTTLANAEGTSTIRHQVEVFLHTDSRAASVVTRMMGPTAPKYAEQGSEQLLLFFSGIARYLHERPERTQSLLAEKK